MSTFKVGDVVCLKSGGPQMTVGNVEPIFDKETKSVITIVTCDWFDAEMVLNHRDFDAEQLVVK